MASRQQRRMALRRKLHILRTLTKSKAVKKSSIIMDTFLYIYKLKHHLEAIKREYEFFINQIQEVKVEKMGTGFKVRVMCKKRQDLLVSILEALEENDLNVLQASVTCKNLFSMEAILQPEDHQQAFDARVISEAVVKAIQKGNN